MMERTETTMAETDRQLYNWGTGRRKTAVARVRIREGTGRFLVNDLEFDAYFPLEIQRTDVRAPLTSTEMAGRVDVFVNVKGSGKHSQSGAVVLGLARALKEYRPDLESTLRENGFLTRDARMVERKKYGHKKARKSFQFSKR
jgi:small subunit ribosomal protein S9